MIAVATFMAAPALYAIGTQFWMFWLEAQGLPSSAFPLAADKAIHQGFVALLIWLAAWLPKWMPSLRDIVVLLLVPVLLLFVLRHFARKNRAKLRVAGRKTRRWIFDRIWPASPHIENAVRSYAIGSAPVLALGVVLYAILVVVLPIQFGRNIGERQGSTDRERIERKVRIGLFAKGDYVVTDNAGEQRLLVLCGEQGCGVMGTRGASFVTWDNIRSIGRWTPRQQVSIAP